MISHTLNFYTFTWFTHYFLLHEAFLQPWWVALVVSNGGGFCFFFFVRIILEVVQLEGVDSSDNG